MAEKKKFKKLSPNWVEIADPSSGRPYYWNTETKETTWTKPEDRIQEDLKKQQEKAQAEAKDVWVERQDPKSGKTYYYNQASKLTSWHRPDKVLGTDVHQAAGKGQWKERIDARTGRPYYYNPILQLTSWTNPDAEDEEQNKQEEPTVKRLSLNPLKRLSGLSQRFSFGKKSEDGGKTRNSARFSLAQPLKPVATNEARVSLRLGADGSLEDKFAALRALQVNKPANVVGEDTAKDTIEFLKIDLAKEMDSLTMEYPFMNISTYIASNFNNKRKTMFGSAKTVLFDQLSSFQKTPIKKALHPFGNKDLNHDAIFAHKLILWYCGEKTRKNKTSEELAQEFITLGVGTDEKFKDELFCQMIKHTTRNPREASTEHAYELLTLACGVFSPTDEFRPFLLSFLRQKVEVAPTPKIKDLATYAILRLERLTERRSGPSLQEIVSVCTITPVEVRVDLISAAPLTVQVDCWTTVQSLKENIEKRFQIQDGTPFALYEITDGDKERVLEDDNKILDLLGYWETISGQVQLMFKIRLYFDINEDDTAAIELAYLQAVYEVIDQRYPCERIDAIRLAAFEAQEKFGDFQNTDVFAEQLALYIPHKFYEEDEVETLKEDIFREYAKLKGVGKIRCMVNYLNYVKRWKFYGAAYYLAEPIQLKVLGKEFPKQVLLGINAKGVLIVEPDDVRLIVEYPYSEIVTWGHSAQNFVLVIGNLVRSTKLFFNTTDGQEMNSLIHAYVSKIMEAQDDDMFAKTLAAMLGQGEGAAPEE